MPKGEPNTQTRATDKYQKKMGIISKSFKMKREIADEFAAACDRAGVSQAATVTAFMKRFIEEHR